MTVNDAAEIALGLPNVTEGKRWGNRTWFVAGKAFAWERPLSKADLRRLGDKPPPQGPLLALRVANLEEKEVLMLDPPDGVFDIRTFQRLPSRADQARRGQAEPRQGRDRGGMEGLLLKLTGEWDLCRSTG